MFLPKKTPFNIKSGYLAPPVIIVLALIVLFVAATLIVNAKLFPKSKPSPTPIAQPSQSPTPSPLNQTANWKTYTSPHRKFTLKYPDPLIPTSKWLVNQPSWIDEGVLSTTAPWNASISSTNLADYLLEFSIRPRFGSETLDSFVNRTIKEQSTGFFNSDYYISNVSKKEIQVSGQQALWVEGQLGPGTEHVEVYIPKNDTSVLVIELWDSQQPPTAEHQKNLDQILSTFQFLD